MNKNKSKQPLAPSMPPPFGHHGVAVIPLDAMAMPETLEAQAYWCAKRGTRPMPSPQEVNPTEIPRLLANLLIIDVLPGPPRDFQFRIEGDKIRTALGLRVSLKGQRLSACTELLGEPVQQDLFKLYGAVCESRAPLAFKTRLTRFVRSFYEAETVYLPLSADGETVTRILGCVGTVLRQGL